MDRLVIAVVHGADSEAVGDSLREAGHRFTVLPSVGGFLGTENATFLVGCERDALDGVLMAVERASSRRDIEVPLVLLGRLKDWQASVVAHGAATVFVLEVKRSAQL